MRPIVLFVDDDIRMLQAIKRSMRKEPYEVLIADSPLDAIKILQGIQVHVLVSDHYMPGLTGVEFCAIVEQEFPDCVKIMLTGAKDFKVTAEAINCGRVFRYVLKPCTNIELAIHVRDAIDHHQIEREKRELLNRSQGDRLEIKSLEKQFPGISSVQRTEDGSVILEE